MAQVREIVDRELGFAEHTETPKQTAFVCVVNKRVVGMVLAEAIEIAYLLLSSPSTTAAASEKSTPLESRIRNHATETVAKTNRRVASSSNMMGLERSKESRKAALGIHQMWVHFNYRNRGIASQLIDAARANMVFGYTVPVDQMAFSSPTEAGVRFARQYNSRQQAMPSSLLPLNCRCDDDAEVLVYDCCYQ